MSNWPLYIDIDEKTKKRPTLDQFTADTGVKVDYIEDVNDNDEWFGKNRAALSQGQSIDRDITVLTDWMAGRMIRLGYVEKLDKAAIPNASQPRRHPRVAELRPGTRVHAAVAVGDDGHRLSTHCSGEVNSIVSSRGPEAKGKVTFLTEMPDTMGLLLQLDGADPGDFTSAQWDAAIARLQKAVDSGQIRQFTGNDYSGPAREGRHLGLRGLVG